MSDETTPKAPGYESPWDKHGVPVSDETTPKALPETTSSGFVVGTPDSSGTMLSISEASKRLGVSVSTLRRRLQRGEVPGAHKAGGPDGLEWRIPVAYVPTSTPSTVSETPSETSRVLELESALNMERALRQRAEDEVESLRGLLSSALDKLPKALPETTSERPRRRGFLRRRS